MANSYFSVKRDNGLITSDSHFWCEGCLYARPLDDQSPDPRYCQSCCELLKAEAMLLPARKKPAWVPKTTKNTREGYVNTPRGQGGVAKVIQPITPHITEKQVIMKQHGRPRKEGEVSRATVWRRRKEAKQGVLL